MVSYLVVRIFRKYYFV